MSIKEIYVMMWTDFHLLNFICALNYISQKMKVNEISFLKGTLIFIKTCHEDSLLYEHVFVIRYLSYLDMRKVCSNLLDQICFNVLKKFFFLLSYLFCFLLQCPNYLTFCHS